MTFIEYKAAIEALMKHLKISLDEAIVKTEVPVHLVARLKDYFNPKLVKIRPPTIIKDASMIPLCIPLNKDHPQPYIHGFCNYLLNNREWSRNVVENLSETSHKLVCRLPQPKTSQHFQWRGLVVGHIQSGKTANMAALIARAADQGYRLFVILSGLYRDLRSQTQDRLDQEITGLSDNPDIGALVKHDPGTPEWIRMTQSGMAGEFRSGTTPWDPSLDKPKLAVIKKNVRVMDQFINLISRSPVRREDFPVMVLDDEADWGSINTNYEEIDESGTPVDPSATNGRIRDLVALFPKCAYVGFTATPFANVLIDAAIEEDLYPRNFIAVLPEPEKYFGPRRLFGLGMLPSELSPEDPQEPELDIIRPIEEADLTELDELTPTSECPEVLKKAILMFVLSSAGRLARGQSDHFTMLVHPSHEIASHTDFARVVREEIGFLRTVLEHPPKSAFRPVIQKAEQIWNTDFTPLTKSLHDPACSLFEFDEVWKFAKPVLQEIDIKILNSGSDDELDYRTGSKKRYIVIGGNRLSRGLTLEGLSISIFLRDSRQYDTLLQMGRWFGYREGYHDLTRIFVEQRMADAFADLARVEVELREDLSQYSKEPNPPTPMDLMPRIRAHSTLAVTSRLKMGAGARVNISLQHSRAETITFPLDNRAVLIENQAVLRAWIEQLGNSGKQSKDGFYYWTGVPPATVIELLRSYKFSKDAVRVNSQTLTQYIKTQNKHKELTTWDIVIPRGNASRDPYTWAKGISTNKVVRARMKIGRNAIRVLASPADIQTWQDTLKRNPQDPTRGGLLLYAVDHKSKEGSLALFDDPEKGADVIGLTFVFPGSTSNATIEYMTQQEAVV